MQRLEQCPAWAGQTCAVSQAARPSPAPTPEGPPRSLTPDSWADLGWQVLTRRGDLNRVALGLSLHLSARVWLAKQELMKRLSPDGDLRRAQRRPGLRAMLLIPSPVTRIICLFVYLTGSICPPLPGSVPAGARLL